MANMPWLTYWDAETKQTRRRRKRFGELTIRELDRYLWDIADELQWANEQFQAMSGNSRQFVDRWYDDEPGEARESQLFELEGLQSTLEYLRDEVAKTLKLTAEAFTELGHSARIDKIKAIAERGATEGEREAARRALLRIDAATRG